MKLILVNESKVKVGSKIFIEVLEKVKNYKEDEVELLLTNNETIRSLNKKFREKDEATDVLSFPMLEGDELWGQIVISVERAKKQAEELNQSLEEELKFLFAHGLLHLLGYDHQTPEEEALMLKETYRLIGRKFEQ